MVRSSGVLLVVAWLLLLGLCEGQSSQSSSNTSVAVSRTASTTTSRSTSSSASAVPSARPALDSATRATLYEKTVYSLVLNKTHPAYFAFLSPVKGAVEVLLNIENLGPEDEQPRVFVTTSGTGGISFDGRETYDRSSGGTWHAGWNTHYEPASWEVMWDNGFGNWTNGANRNGVVLEHDVVTPRLLIGRGINDDLLLEPTKDGNVTVTLTYVMFSE